MIKKYLLGLFSVFVGLVCFCNGEFTLQGNYYSSDTNQLSYEYGDSYSYIVTENSNFITNTSFNFFWPNFSNNTLINFYNLGRIDGDLYFFQNYNSNIVQGFINKWCIVPASSRGVNGFLHNNCSYQYDLNDVINSVGGNIFTKYFIEVVGASRPTWFFNYSELNFCLTDNVNDYCVSCGSQGCSSGLTGSLNLNFTDYSSTASYSWGSSPFSFGIKPITGTINNSISGDYVYYDCTYRDILILMNTEGYNKYICYGGLDNFDLYDSSLNYSPIPGSGLSISQIWAWSGSRAWDNFSDWFHFWNGIYRDSDNNYNSMWGSYPAVYRTYFQLYNTYNSTEYGSLNYSSADYILNYCQLLDNLNNNNFDIDSSVGGQFKPFCEVVVREKQTGVWNDRADGSIYSDGVYTGDVPISVNWDGVGSMSGSSDQKDGLTFIQDFFNLNKTALQDNYNDLTGIIPGYILIFMLGLILFRFISR